MKKLILILLVLLAVDTLSAQSAYFKRIQVADSIYNCGRINAGAYYLNGVLITFSVADTSLLLHDYDSTRWALRWKSLTFSDTGRWYGTYNLDTTKFPKLSMNNTFTGSNIFTKDISFTKGGSYTIGTTDNYGIRFKTNGTNFMRVDSSGNIRGNHPSYDNWWYILNNGASFFASIATNGVFTFSNYLYSTSFQGQNGSPEGVTTYTMGSYVARKDGGIGTSAYIKETTSGSTGWNPVKTNRSDTISTYASSRTITMLGTVFKCTPTQNCTFNASGGVAGNMITFYFTTSGTTDYRITFGTNFRSSAVIDMGSTTAKVHTVTFVCKDGTEWAEISRVMNM